MVVFNDIDDLEIGGVDGVVMACGETFALTLGIASGGDILVEADSSLHITEAINADGGVDDVRLIANGDLIQTASGTITANFLGVRQERLVYDATHDFDGNGTFDILLCEDNLVDTFAASNTVGDVYFHNTQDLTIGEVTTQTIGNLTFATTTGVTAGLDAVVQVDGNLQIDEAIMAVDEILLDANGYLSIDAAITGAEVRLISGGDVLQTASGTITSDLLGVRQEAAVYSASADMDGNGLFDIILDDGNDVNVLGAFNAFEDGVVVFNDTDDLTIERVDTDVMACGETFSETIGVKTTFAGPGTIGAGDGTSGDVLIDAGGFLRINEAILAGVDSTDATNRGNSDVRLIADGDVSQSDSGIIIAQELGVRQENVIGGNQIQLDEANDVRTFSASNESVNGFVVFNDTDEAVTDNLGLAIFEVASQTIGDVSFATTEGVSTTFGDILINSDGFLQISDQLSAANGSSDIRLIANGDIHETTTSEIRADELGVRQRAAVVDADYDLPGLGSGKHDIYLSSLMRTDPIIDPTLDPALDNNDVDFLSLVNLNNNGDLLFRDSNSLTVSSVAAQTIGNITFELVSGVTSDNGLTIGVPDGSGDIVLAAGITLDDAVDIPIITEGGGFFRGNVDVELADDVGDRLWIGMNASFHSPDIEVGQDSVAAGTVDGMGLLNVLFGSITVNDDNDISTNLGQADLTEDDSSLLSGTSSSGILVLTSSVDITNATETTMLFEQVQFNAEDGVVFIGNMTDDFFGSGAGVADEGTEVELGVVAVDVSIAANTAIEINGEIPLDPSLNLPHFPVPAIDPFVLGTEVNDVLFVTSFSLTGLGHVEQTAGSLNASQIGIATDNHVHLNSVMATNSALAISAGDSGVANLPAHQDLLFSLDAIDGNASSGTDDAIVGSEVESSLMQSISIAHEGDLVVDLVFNPDAGGVGSVKGVFTSASTAGSIFLTAPDSMTLNEDVSASSTGSLPEVTVYVEANDPTKITFNDAAIRVTGDDGVFPNEGVVNNPTTEAFFGVDTDGNGALDTFFFDENNDGILQPTEQVFVTTTVIRLDASNTAVQDIESIYGHTGEEGYRFALVWDSQRRFDFGFASAQEQANLYTQLTNDSEIFPVAISDQDAAGMQLVSDLDFQTDLIEQVAPFAGDYNFDTVFAKVENWTANALSLRIDDPRVFTTVEVRNDQDINLFVGAIGVADNSLNAVSYVLEARIENPSFGEPGRPVEIEPNPIPFRPPPPPLPEQPPFIQPPEPPEFRQPEVLGKLSWLPVEIGNLVNVPDEADGELEDHILEVDGELILKNPEADYEPLNEGELPHPFEDADKNQVDKIIQEIENDPNAEAGLWYKIFINNVGKKDEFLFYYFKTGNQQTDDLGPESDFEKNAAEINDHDQSQPPEADGEDQASDNESANNDGRQIPAFKQDPFLDPGASSESIAVRELSGSEKLGLSSGTILLAALAKRKRGESTETVVSQLGSLKPDVGFSRFDRLKRRVASMIGNQKH